MISIIHYSQTFVFEHTTRTQRIRKKNWKKYDKEEGLIYNYSWFFDASENLFTIKYERDQFEHWRFVGILFCVYGFSFPISYIIFLCHSFRNEEFFKCFDPKKWNKTINCVTLRNRACCSIEIFKSLLCFCRHHFLN